MIKLISCSAWWNRVKRFVATHKCLMVLVCVSLTLRAAPLLWGIPLGDFVQSYHPDERKVLRSLWNFPGIYFSTDTFMGYGTFVQYTLGALAMPLKLLFSLLDSLNSYRLLTWMMARFFNVLMGSATIVFTYFLAERIYDRKVALLSASFLAFSLYHVLNSAVMTVDVAMSLAIVINFILCLYAVQGNAVKPFVYLGVASGILMGTKITGALFMVVPVVLVLTQMGKTDATEWHRARAHPFTRLIAYGLAAAAVYLFYHPHVIIDPAKYIDFFVREKQDWVDRTSVPLWNMFPIWFSSTSKSVGLPIALLAMAGVFLPKRANVRFHGALVFFLVASLGIWRWFLLPRYVISITPLLCILAANAGARLLAPRSAVLRTTGIGIVATSLLISLYFCISGVHLRLSDTRTAAARYIAHHIPEGHSIGLGYVSESYKQTHPWVNPRIDWNTYAKADFMAQPDIIVISSYAFGPILHALEAGEVDGNYVVKKEFVSDWYRNSPPSPSILRFYDHLLTKKDNGYVLQKVFKPVAGVPIEFPPPEVRIYRRAA